MDYTFHWYPAFKLLPKMLVGSITTIEVAFLSMLFGIILGATLALAKNSSNKIFMSFANTWIEVSRNTPALYQIYMAYFGLGTFGIYVGSFGALLIGITFNNAGYLAEIFRGGLRAIPATQMKTARSLGMNFFQAFIYVIFPQLFKTVFHSVTNQTVWAILMTSLGVVVGMNTDLMGVTNELNALSFRTFEYFSLAAVLYYLITKLFLGLAHLLNLKLFRY
ncbi:amino acid ABC transporter permease [Pseudomonadota bacterium]